MKTNQSNDVQPCKTTESLRNNDSRKFAQRFIGTVKFFSCKAMLLLFLGICYAFGLNAGVSKNIIITAGTLSSALTQSELATITSLTLSGTIDARDFKIMRYNMPLLKEVDLEGADIVAYSGSEGPYYGSLDYPVNTIPKSAFNNKPITIIKIPLSATSIGDEAFGNCVFLTSISIPSSVLSIGDWAFTNCQQLSSIYIPSSVKIIGENTFSDFKGSFEVDINNPYYSSQDSVLFDKFKTVLIQCSNKKTGNYVIPSSVISITGVAFGSNSTLASVKVPSSVISIGDYSFNMFRGSIIVSNDNPNYSSEEGVLFNKDKTTLIHCPLKKAGSYDIPATVTSIRTVAFQNCSALTTINFPASLTYIGDSSFGNCTGLTTLNLPASINYVGYNAFNSCGGINSITFPASISSIKGGAFFGVNNLTSIYVHARNPIPIDNNIFININYAACKLYVPFGTSGLYATAYQWKDFPNIIEMPGFILSTNNVTLGTENSATISIKASNSIDSIKISSDQPWLTLSTVAGNTGETILTLNADENATSEILKATITVSAKGLSEQFISVIKLGKLAVTAGGLKNTLGQILGSVTSLTLTGTIDARDFKTMRDQMPLLSVLNLSEVKIAAYTGTEGPKVDNTYYSADEIPEQSFYKADKIIGKTSLTSITLPAKVKIIGSAAFCRCTGLTSIILPSSLTSIKPNAFSYCIGLTSINLPSTITYIGSGAFEMCAGLPSVDIPKLVTSIEAYTFQGCDGFSSISIPATVTSIGNNAFFNCKGLASISIPSSVTSISFRAFAGCPGKIIVDGNNPNYSSMDGILYNKAKTVLLQSTTSLSGDYIIDSRVTSIGQNAFEACSDLTSVTIPKSVVSIGRDAFFYCSGLNTMTVYSGSPIDLSAAYAIFYGINTETATLIVPFGSKEKYAAAKQWKDFSNIIESPDVAPIAKAGANQTIDENILVTLNGTGSMDADDNVINYELKAPKEIVLSSNTTANPTFTAPEVQNDTTLYFTLVVNDGLLSSKTDSVLITVKQVHKAPVANAGIDQQAKENELVTLDGSLSYKLESGHLTYLWKAPAGIVLSSTTAASPTFTAPEVNQDTTLTFSLVVNDGTLASTADEIVITVKNIDKAPYVKVPIENIATDKGSMEKTMDLNEVFADDDSYDVLAYSVISNTNDQVVEAKITGSVLTLRFASSRTGTSDITLMASANGKQATVKFNVDVLSPLGLKPITNNDQVSIYPNPTSGRINLVMDHAPAKGTILTVHDLTGKLIVRLPLDSKELWINLKGTPPGVYLLQTNLKDYKVQRIVLK